MTFDLFLSIIGLMKLRFTVHRSSALSDFQSCLQVCRWVRDAYSKCKGCSRSRSSGAQEAQGPRSQWVSQEGASRSC